MAAFAVSLLFAEGFGPPPPAISGGPVALPRYIPPPLPDVPPIQPVQYPVKLDFAFRPVFSAQNITLSPNTNAAEWSVNDIFGLDKRPTLYRLALTAWTPNLSIEYSHQFRRSLQGSGILPGPVWVNGIQFGAPNSTSATSTTYTTGITLTNTLDSLEFRFPGIWRRYDIQPLMIAEFATFGLDITGRAAAQTTGGTENTVNFTQRTSALGFGLFARQVFDRLWFTEKTSYAWIGKHRSLNLDILAEWKPDILGRACVIGAGYLYRQGAHDLDIGKLGVSTQGPYAQLKLLF